MTATAEGPRRTYLPPRKSEQLRELEQLLTQPDASVTVAVGGDIASAPDELRRVLLDVVTSLRRGNAITVVPSAMRLTTQQAADLLGISRPTLIKLLESGQIPYETPSRHRRVLLTDVLTYQAHRRQERRAALDDLTADADGLGLYDVPPQAYEAALDEARRKRA